MNGLIITSFILWIVGFFVNGFTIYNVYLIAPTIMFALRKFGIHIKMGNIVATEIIGLIFSVLWRLLFKKFHLIRFLIGLLLRIIFICIIVYDDSVYVYVTEERKRVN